MRKESEIRFTANSIQRKHRFAHIWILLFEIDSLILIKGLATAIVTVAEMATNNKYHVFIAKKDMMTMMTNRWSNKIKDLPG
jgi:hypothetical protein